MLLLGLFRSGNTSEWASVPLIVPKKGPEGFCFTSDPGRVNNQTIPHASPTPDLEAVTAQLAGDKFFATISLCYVYCKQSLAEESQECLSFITRWRISVTRVLQRTDKCSTEFYPDTLQGDSESYTAMIFPANWMRTAIVRFNEVLEPLSSVF